MTIGPEPMSRIFLMSVRFGTSLPYLASYSLAAGFFLMRAGSLPRASIV